MINMVTRAGDWLLKAVAQRMETCLRESDTAARIGGDEFIVLLPEIRRNRDAVAVAEKIRDVLNQPFEMSEGDTSEYFSMYRYCDLPRPWIDGKTTDEKWRYSNVSGQRIWTEPRLDLSAKPG